MRQDCADKNGDVYAIMYLFDNIEVVCELKGHTITIEFPTADCTTTTETTTQTTTTEPTTTETTTTVPTTTCIIAKPCYALEIIPFTEVRFHIS